MLEKQKVYIGTEDKTNENTDFIVTYKGIDGAAKLLYVKEQSDSYVFTEEELIEFVRKIGVDLSRTKTVDENRPVDFVYPSIEDYIGDKLKLNNK